jgi:predicted MFS family arabinose efflux permease
MPETRSEGASRSFDWLGAVVVVVAVGGLAFGGIRGQDRRWEDPLAWVSLAVGAVALVAFPVLMARRPDPLVPLGLFRRRAFAAVNLATLLIYGALYTIFAFQGLFLQNTIGYSATAAGVIGLPTGILLTAFSTKVGALSGRIGARPFMIAGPAVLAAGLLWLARVPATTEPWRLAPGDPSSFLPPLPVLVDILPSILLFGVGITLVVAPLTSTLMTSVPVANAGLASAINNAISRIGQPLLSALIFVVVSGSFYAAVAGAVPGFDAADPAMRAAIQPLNPPHPGASAELVAAARTASVEALHLAAAVCAGLLLAGSAVSWAGLRPGDARAATAEGAAQGG